MARILLAEDDTSTLEVLQRALTGDGHDVTAAHDGQEAYDAAMAADYDLLISDVSMPVLDGVSLVEQLLTRKDQLPVILMSAVADELARAQALPKSRVRVVSKPLTIERLREEVRAAIG